MSVEWINLNDEEVAERAKTLAQKIDEQDSLDLERKEKMKDYKKQIDVLNRKIRELSHAIRKKQELKKRTFWDDNIN
jgi:pterin-4a-carbinolamine dehydratase